MKKFHVIYILVIVLASCAPKRDWEKKSVESKEGAIKEQSKNGKVDSAGIVILLRAYESYAEEFPTDTLGASYLFKAADFYRYLRKPRKSIELYNRIYNNYPIFENRPYALFMEGFIYENELLKIDSARIEYEEFLKQFPNHPIAKDVRISIQNLGKTPEQLINEFEQKQREDSIARAKAK